MPTFRATVGPHRAVTLPAALCKRLKIKQGTPVEFFLTTDGQVHFHAITATARGFGGITVQGRNPSISIREMDDGIADYLADQDQRIARQWRKRHQKASSAAE